MGLCRQYRPRHRRSEGALDADEHGNGQFPNRGLLTEMQDNATDALEGMADVEAKGAQRWLKLISV